METLESPAYVFNAHIEAEQAIRSLNEAGFDVKKLSLVGKGYQSEEHPVGFYTAADKIRTWGGVGAFWGGIWDLLLAAAVFFLPMAGSAGTGGTGRLRAGRCARGRGRRRWRLSARRGTDADRRAQGSGDQIRDSDQGRQIPSHRAWKPRGRGEGARRNRDFEGAGDRIAPVSPRSAPPWARTSAKHQCQACSAIPKVSRGGRAVRIDGSTRPTGFRARRTRA
jgi:hypothetical protein